MIDDENRTENPQGTSADGADDLEELRVEDAAVEIDFEEHASSEASVSAGEAEEVDANASSPEQDGSSVLVADLQRQVQGLKAQLEDRTGQYMRIAADFENYRKRTGKEKEDLETQVRGNTVVEMLPVIDNFERARSQIKPQTEQEMTIHKSYQSVYKQLVDCLKRLGVAPMRVEGEEFDPNLHEAVMREPTSDHPEGVIIEEFLRGYLLGERVLRHAMVKVAAPPEPEPESSSEPDDNE
ncbi:nucleotide exchange factor GrpE [filamentous cyanobacterium CCP5]|nr:nucleotide exchange factor GrpE [filamentous cyanobacterium CCP5]